MKKRKTKIFHFSFDILFLIVAVILGTLSQNHNPHNPFSLVAAVDDKHIHKLKHYSSRDFHSHHHHHPHPHPFDPIYNDIERVKTFVDKKLPFLIHEGEIALNDTETFIIKHQKLFHDLAVVAQVINDIAEIIDLVAPATPVGAVSLVVDKVSEIAEVGLSDIAKEGKVLSKERQRERLEDSLPDQSPSSSPSGKKK
eukprot:Nk52_evm9s278 gene=Nk52_evmTU9s278